jgi:endo-1,4-beta-xylanase
MNTWQITGKDTVGIQVIKDQFEAFVAENCMKSGPIHPAENEYNLSFPTSLWILCCQKQIHNRSLPDLAFAAPQWFFTDSLGNDVSREVMIERMKNHIYTVVGRYKGRVKGWDVVNEAIMEDGSLRNTKFLQIVGEDYIKLAFQFAHEADPDAELYYNDYNEWYPGKRDAVVKMVNDLKAEGIRVDGLECRVTLEWTAFTGRIRSCHYCLCLHWS